MKIVIRHELSLPIGSGHARALQHLLLTPLTGPTQLVKDWTLEAPGIDKAAWFTDSFGNRCAVVSQSRPEEELLVRATGTIETYDRNGVLGRSPAEPVPALFKRATALTAPDPRLLEPLRGMQTRGSARIALFHLVMAQVQELYSFGEAEPTDIETEATGVQRQSQGTGSQSQTQDGQSQSQGDGAQSQSGGDEPAADRQPADAATVAHAFIGTLRALGIPARYVTGYLAADEDRPGAVHAWAEAFDEGLGWIAFDAALGLCPIDRHVRVAVGLDAFSAQLARVVPSAGEARVTHLSVEAKPAS